MALSETGCKAFMNAIRTEYGLNLDIEKEWTYWQRRLLESGLTDENAPRMRAGFAAHFTVTNRNPKLNDIVRFLKTSRPATTAARWRPPVALDCAYCQDSGWVVVLAPYDRANQHFRWASDYRPGETYTAHQLYEASLPCCCHPAGTKAAERSPLGPDQERLRDAFIAWWNSQPASDNWTMFCKHRRACTQARNAPPKPRAKIRPRDVRKPT